MTTEELEDDIQYIRQIIENSQRALIDNGIIFISMGIGVLIGFALNFLLLAMGLPSFIPYIWIIIVFLMVLASEILPRRIDPNLPKKTFASAILEANWAVTGLPMIVLMLLFFFTDRLSLPALIVADSALLGAMFFMHGTILKLKMMKGLAFIWWVYMIVMVLWGWTTEPFNLVQIFLFLVGVLALIPGIILFRKWRGLHVQKQV